MAVFLEGGKLEGIIDWYLIPFNSPYAAELIAKLSPFDWDNVTTAARAICEPRPDLTLTIFEGETIYDRKWPQVIVITNKEKNGIILVRDDDVISGYFSRYFTNRELALPLLEQIVERVKADFIPF